MTYKVFRTLREAAKTELGIATPDWAMRLLESSPRITRIEARVTPVLGCVKALPTWAVEISLAGVPVSNLHPDQNDPRNSVKYNTSEGRALFMGSPREMRALVERAMEKYVAQ